MPMNWDGISEIIQLNGGQLVGRTRLQKTFYFLETAGVGFDFDFDYHHYGPYSEEVSVSADFAQIVGLIDEDWSVGKNGSKFAVFKSRTPNEATNSSVETTQKRKKILSVLDCYDSVSIELAATADFLSKSGYEKSFWEETTSRKPAKATKARLNKAREILSKIGSI